MATATTTTPTTDPPIHALVIDAGPLIANTSASSLLSRAQRIYTTPAVVAEIRDAATRSRLETTWLPFLAQRTPRAESVRVVAEFARRTGDFAALSVTDVQLLALTYELECEGNGGDWRLRRVPGQRGVNGPVPGRGDKGKEEEEKEGEGVREKKQEEEEGGAATAESKEAETAKPKRKSKRARMAAKKRAERQEAGEGSEKAGETGEPETEAQPPPQPEQAVPAEGKKRNKRKGRKAAPAQDGAAAGELNGAEAAEAGEEEEAEGEAAAEPRAEAAEKPAPKPAAAEAASQDAPAEAPAATTLPTPPSTDDSAASASDPASDSDSDSDSGWITATNLHSYRHSAAHTPVAGPATTKKQWPLAAALATTDYAMQNVLLQMNLHLVSPHGLHRIRAIRTWVLRCHACFKLCRDMARQFCPTCGGATLLKTSCSTDSTGAFTLHLKRNMQWNNRGAVYSIPKTQHGSASGKGVRRNLVLREDQIEYQREVRVRARQKERDLLDPDYLPGILTGERREAGGAVPKIGYGRRNPNERQGGRNKH